MNIFGFDTYIDVSVMEKFLPSNWKKINSDPVLRVYEDKEHRDKAVIACDENGEIKYSYILHQYKNGWSPIYMYSGIYQNIRSYADIVFVESVEKSIDNRHGVKCPEWMQFEKKLAIREALKRIAKYKTDGISVPLQNDKKQWRTVSDNDGESCTDFIIISDRWSDKWGTDAESEAWEDIEDFVFNTVGYRSCYDFPTGRMITLSWHFTRIPAGIAIVHHRGIDW